MSLEATLNDLSSDVDNVSLEHSIVNEDLLNNNQQESKFKISLSSLDQGTIDKFSRLYDQVSIKKIVTRLDKVDYNIAQEVFTMLPDITKSDQAKVTSQPSYINKELLEKVLTDVSDVIPEDTISLMNSVTSQIENNKECILEVEKTLKGIIENTAKRINHLKESKPIIISDRRSIDLLTSPFNDIIYIDDKTIDYKKYEDKLCSMYRELVDNDSLRTFININRLDENSYVGVYEYSLLRIYEDLCEANSRVNCAISSLENGRDSIVNLLNSENIQVDENTYNVVNKISTMISNLEYLKKLHDIVENKDNFLEQYQSLVLFID